MSTSSRESIPLPAIKSRKRASTRALLGEEYPVDATKNVATPKPLLSASDYTKARFKEGLIFAETILRNPTRKLSPIGQNCAKIYKEACARLLDMDEDGEIYDEEPETINAIREEWISNMRGFERDMQYLQCLKLTKTETAQQLQDSIIELLKYRFYARYGDIFNELCNQLKRNAERLKVAGWQTLQQKYWTDINKKIQQEKLAWEKYLKGEKCEVEAECTTHIAIMHACGSVGFSMDEMIAIIEQYAIRNTMLHSNLMPLVKAGKFHTLSLILYNDLSDVEVCVSEAEQLSCEMLKNIISKMIAQWFTFDSTDLQNPEAWIASPALIECRKELGGEDPKKQAKLEKDIVAWVIKAIRYTEKETEKEKVIKEFVGLKLADPKPFKRVASSKLAEEIENAKKQRKDWQTLSNISHALREASSKYIKDYDNLEAPREVVEDPLL